MLTNDRKIRRSAPATAEAASRVLVFPDTPDGRKVLSVDLHSVEWEDLMANDDRAALRLVRGVRA